MLRKSVILSIAIFLLFGGACQENTQEPLILVSKEYGNTFMNWLARADNTIARINMNSISADSIDHFLSISDGIIISGGPDINPDIYGKGSALERCGPIDHRRDTLELRMIRYAMENNIPLLCICRGHQILNAANGGTLIIDIPTDHDTIIAHRQDGKHMVRVIEGSLLSDIIEQDSGMVNSRHHQAVEMLAPGFRVSALAPDGIIEAIELVDRTQHPFVLGIQWHPETMIRESDGPFSLPLAIQFMEAVHRTLK